MTDAKRERLARSLQHHREEAGLTKTELADEAGYSSVYIRKIEAGRCGMSLTALTHVAEALDVETYILIKDVAL